MSTSELAELLPPDEYGAQRRNVFPSGASLEWYMRKHRQALVACGALRLIAGRHKVLPSRFDAHVLEAGTSAAAQRQKAAA